MLIWGACIKGAAYPICATNRVTALHISCPQNSIWEKNMPGVTWLDLQRKIWFHFLVKERWDCVNSKCYFLILKREDKPRYQHCIMECGCLKQWFSLLCLTAGPCEETDHGIDSHYYRAYKFQLGCLNVSCLGKSIVPSGKTFQYKGLGVSGEGCPNWSHSQLTENQELQCQTAEEVGWPW